MKYTFSNPVPNPLKAVMSRLMQYGATVVDAYPDGKGHHLLMNKGTLGIHVTLALDWIADGVDWADGDLSWRVSDGGEDLTLERWSDVCRTLGAKV